MKKEIKKITPAMVEKSRNWTAQPKNNNRPRLIKKKLPLIIPIRNFDNID